MSDRTVRLSGDLTGSTLLHGALAGACATWPSTFAGFDLPAAPQLKGRLVDTMSAFEARRTASPDRIAIARQLHRHVLANVTWGEVPLAEAVATAADPGPVTEVVGTAAAGWRPEVVYDGVTYGGDALSELVRRMRRDHLLSDGAAEALEWSATHLVRDGAIDLTGQRFALMGAGAELSPAVPLLEAGARVLWVDRQAPELPADRFAGTLVFRSAATDLLADPAAVAAAVAAEGAEGLHVGLFAYAPGKGREIRLTAAMNAVVEAVGPASASLLVSPTTPGPLEGGDRRNRYLRRRLAPRWQRVLCRAGVLPEHVPDTVEAVQVARSIVPLQGPTYMAAQYLAKMATAEAWVADRPAMRVSANVAGITNTRSLAHPLFQAGFLGATRFGVHVFSPAQSQVLMTLILLHDLLRPDAPGACDEGGPEARAARLASQAVHGGVRSAPFDLDRTIRVAAVLGLLRQPSLLWSAR